MKRVQAAILAVARLFRRAESEVGGEVVVLRRELARVSTECELLRARLRRLRAESRPRFRPWERLQVLWHGLRYGLSLGILAETFVVSVASLERWREAVARKTTLVETRRPANKLADVVDELILLLRFEHPAWGTRRILLRRP